MANARDIKQQVAFLNDKVSRYIPIKEVDGFNYGLELELEGRNVAMGEGVATKGWKRVADGSLRGESIEYVFNGTANYKESRERVSRLFKLFKENDVKIKNSYRTSTHVHLNFSDKKFRQVVNFFALFTVLEEFLEAYCGEGRNGNLFCLSNRDVEGVVKMVEEAVQHCSFADFGENVRYCAVNLCALNKFGSIELRTMRGADNEQMVLDWLDICKELYEYACNKMESPVKLIENLSVKGVDGFLADIFTANTLNNLLNAWQQTGKPLHYSLMEGARLIQFLAYRVEEAFRAPFVEEAPVNGAEPPLVRYYANFLRGGRFLVPANFKHRNGAAIPGAGHVLWIVERGCWFDTITREHEDVNRREIVGDVHDWGDIPAPRIRPMDWVSYDGLLYEEVPAEPANMEIYRTRRGYELQYERINNWWRETGDGPIWEWSGPPEDEEFEEDED